VAGVGLGLVLLVAVKVAVVALSLYPLARPGAAHFQGKAMTFRAILYPAVMLLIPLVWLVAGRPSPYPVLADIALAVPFLVDAGANDLGLFAIKGFDAIPHVSGWFFLTLAFGLAIAPLSHEPWIAFGLAVGFGAVLDVVWEIGEFVMMKSGASGLDLTYANTIQDLGMSLLGAVAGGVVIATLLWSPPGTPATLFGWQ
jgi:hypothetical protein